MLLCVRTLKVLEQIVLSRSKSIVGPLTVCMFISGSLEVSPSFASIKNSLGQALSYNATKRFRLKLIADREKCTRGAWDSVPFLDSSYIIPSCRFDNWDILSFHALKVTGKNMPKVNGSLSKAFVWKEKPDKATSEPPLKKQKLLE